MTPSLLWLAVVAAQTDDAAAPLPPPPAPPPAVRTMPSPPLVKAQPSAVARPRYRAAGLDEQARKARAARGSHLVKVHKDENGYTLLVDGQDFMVYGINWTYIPIGQNYAWDLWSQPDEVIIEALDYEMGLLQDMGVNTLRLFDGVPPRWVTYIYEKYNIFSVINHTIGRYGYAIDGAYRNVTDYSDPRTREVLRGDLKKLANRYKNVPGVLMYLLGNENNYGLYWSSTEIEDLPVAQQGDMRATFLYSLFGEIIDDIHAIDTTHPVAIANGDLQFIDVIAKECGNMDIMGSNVYRGVSSGDLFDVVEEKLGVPFVYTEFGADAYDAKRGREDGAAQAYYNIGLWKEIYAQSYGKGKVGNAIGGMIFQWSDGWWKYKQQTDLDVHNTYASWANAAYPLDLAEGKNNMNEEWFGIMAKGPPDEKGLFPLYARESYYALKKAFELDPYAATTTPTRIEQHFGSIRGRDFSPSAGSARLESRLQVLEKVVSTSLRVELETVTTGGSNLNVPERVPTRFDHQQSIYMGLEVRPTDRIKASATVNVLGNVAVNPIDEIFFENRGQPAVFEDVMGDDVQFNDIERIKIYQAKFEWEDDWFRLEGFYRSGHYHWGYEGDFFGLFPEANYQHAVDTFNADTPSGVIITGKKTFDGLKLAFGPELTWGANPSIIGKYYREFGKWKFSFLHQQDIAQRVAGPTSSVIPVPQAARTTAYLGYQWGPLLMEFGGIMAGTNFIGRRYSSAQDAPDGQPSYLGSGYYILDDEIEFIDTLGGKVKLTLELAPFRWYVQGGYRGLVADAGWDPTITFTGWSLKESGQGNHWAVSSGLAYNVGDFQFAPNVLIQQPLEGPLPQINDFYDASTGTYFAGTVGRNQLNDPFWVRSNRETYAFEFLIGFDPTPATWMWAWDNLDREDAPFAAALDITYKVLPTIMDAAIGVTSDGIVFGFPGSVPARDLWDVKLRTIMNFSREARLVNMIYVGEGQSNGIDPRPVTRFGTEGWLTYGALSASYFVKVDDWGPFDYYRDFNLTFPLQTMLDLSYQAGPAKILVPVNTRIGMRGKYRILDEFSGRIAPNAVSDGSEWEFRTYVHISL